MTHLPNRKSIRLKGFDYAQEGDYFVTICALHSRHLFGQVRNASVHLTELGDIADRQWRDIPSHYENVSLGAHKVMPNHLHGIITITSSPNVLHRPERVDRAFGKSTPNSLSSIIGSYKAGVTRRAHEGGYLIGATLWQSRFHDHIIRDDRSRFLIEQYIELNPLFWEYDPDNGGSNGILREEAVRLLKDRFDVDGRLAGMILEWGRIKLVG